jgi:prophage regulatory protein
MRMAKAKKQELLLSASFTEPEADRIVREEERLQITQVSPVTWWRWERDGWVPPKIRLGPNSVGWSLYDLRIWIRIRKANPRTRILWDDIIASVDREKFNLGVAQPLVGEPMPSQSPPPPPRKKKQKARP